MSGGGAPESPPRAKRMRVAAAAAAAEDGGGSGGSGGGGRFFPSRRVPNLLGEWADAPAPALQPLYVVKSSLALPAGHPSPGALQGCRIALQARTHSSAGAPLARVRCLRARSAARRRVMACWGCT
jgi:hypothetical protein